jgi:glycosyltransferase involved in cell wall biosynthesis
VIWHELNVRQRFPGNLIQSIYARTLGKAVVRRAALFVPRNWQARDYLATVGVPSSKIGEVIHHAVDTEVFSPSGDREGLRRQLDLDPDCFLILSVGRLAPYKGHRYLLLALRKVLDECPQGRLLIVGQGPERNNLYQLAETLGIAGNVTMIEHVAKRELAKYYNAADVMALPSSEKELFPNFAILESLACGTPVIFSDPGGAREIGGDGLCGCYVPFGDPDELARRILQLIDSPQRRIEMSRAALDLVRSQFALGVIASKWVQVYEAVTKGGQGGLQERRG